jgi:hypothetical protein
MLYGYTDVLLPVQFLTYPDTVWTVLMETSGPNRSQRCIAIYPAYLLKTVFRMQISSMDHACSLLMRRKGKISKRHDNRPVSTYELNSLKYNCFIAFISGFRRDAEICDLLGYYAASCGNCLPTFRDSYLYWAVTLLLLKAEYCTSLSTTTGFRFELMPSVWLGNLTHLVQCQNL